MNVVFHQDFYDVYVSDPAAEPGRMEAIVEAIREDSTFISPDQADLADILLAHDKDHVESVKKYGLYPIAALAAGGAIKTAELALKEPCFGLIRPPGHHASAGSAWGFCYFNNMAIALLSLHHRKMIKSAFVLDFDMHYGDGTVNILENHSFVNIYNPESRFRDRYMKDVREKMERVSVDMIGISAGFDNHSEDWGGVLLTEDFFDMGVMVKKAAERSGGHYFALLEGGYNHKVIGKNAQALITGMEK
ncbi:MAG: histone deacetylase family protein [Proteobacteria bacterium]|nr:histone deacetylase family protein [Pseudomonadota bacterium]